MTARTYRASNPSAWVDMGEGEHLHRAPFHGQHTTRIGGALQHSLIIRAD